MKLIDVYPEKNDANAPQDPKMSGFQLMIAGDVLRGRYRNGFEQPEPVAADSIQQLPDRISRAMTHVFLKGHRIMVQVQSTWFPVIRPQSAAIYPKYFSGERIGFSSGDAANLSLGSTRLVRKPPDRSVDELRSDGNRIRQNTCTCPTENDSAIKSNWPRRCAGRVKLHGDSPRCSVPPNRDGVRIGRFQIKCGEATLLNKD